MKPIEIVRKELHGILDVWWSGKEDYIGRPTWLSRNAQQIHGTGTPVFEANTDFDYPQWTDAELFASLDREVSISGIDALAWYVSFHHLSPWGIFIPISSLAYLENRVFRRFRRSRFSKWQFAMDMLLQHELFHFATDYMSAQWEILMQAPCWAALAARKQESGATYLPIEEKLANAYMLRKTKNILPINVWRTVQKFVTIQPEGYREGIEDLEETKFVHDLGDLLKVYAGLQATERDLHLFPHAFDCDRFFPLESDLLRTECPLFIIHDESRLSIPEIISQLILCMPSIIETKQFQKQLARIEKPIQEKWLRKKRQLAECIPRHPEFEKFGDVYSLRLGDNFRVHLRPSKGESKWEAIGVGTHKEMGHG